MSQPPGNEKPPAPGPDYRSVGIGAGLSIVGLTIALSIGIGAGAGVLADRWLHTGGILVIVGTGLGIVAGFKQLFTAVARASRQEDALEAEERKRREGGDRQ
jgi:F0F1-type ATP synthase assembly protein I